MTMEKKVSYGEAICSGFQYLLGKYPNVFTIGQGLWAPWYVGNSMKNLDKDFGVGRVIDSPVSEAACTGAAIGASLCGYRPIIIHPRMDFMLLTIDQVVNQAAKWSHMLGGQAHPAVTIRGIINRGGEQGAQHSQALHAWFAHVPGLRVVMPATVKDARDLLVASVLSDDPVLYIDDRWLYEMEDVIPPVEEEDLSEIKPQILKEGKDITLVGSSFSAQMCLEAGDLMTDKGIGCEVIDLRVINPLDVSLVVESVKKTGRLCAVDGGWRTCGLAGEVIVSVMEEIDLEVLKTPAKRITLPDAPAPSSKVLEEAYYPSIDEICSSIIEQMG